MTDRPRPRKSDKTGRNTPEAKHVRLYKWLLRSPAWQSLPPSAAKLLIEFYQRYNGSNNGDILMSVRQAEKVLGCSINHAHKMLRELEDRGFIKPRQRGSFNLKKRHATTWILTEHDVDGRKPTKDFMRWQPPSDGAQIQNTVSRGDTDGITRRYRGSPKDPPTVSRCDTGTIDFAPSTVSPHDTRLVYHGTGDTAPAGEPTKTSSSPSEQSEVMMPVGDKGGPKNDQKRPDCRPSFQPRSKALSGRQKAEWLRERMCLGDLNREQVAVELGFPPNAVDDVAGGKVGLSPTQWRKVWRLHRAHASS